MNQDMQQLLNAILPELVAIRADLGALKSELKGDIARLSHLAAVELAKNAGELAEMKAATATHQEVSDLCRHMDGRFDRFADQVMEFHMLRSEKSREYKEQQAQINDHERRLTLLEAK